MFTEFMKNLINGIDAHDVVVTEPETRPELPPVAHSLKVLLGVSGSSHSMRICSDDYDMYESGIPCGDDYGVRIGDVTFRFHFRNYDAYSVSVYVDQTYIMTYTSGGKIAVANEREIPPSLSAHIQAAATTLTGKMELKRIERQVGEMKWEAEIAERDAAVFSRFT